MEEHHPLQRELPLMGRLDGPSIVPAQYLVHIRSYRQAVRLCWALRRVRNLTLMQLAAEADLVSQHISDYLAKDDKPRRRSLPAEKVCAFESVCGNNAVSQWLAQRSQLTVLEQVQATARVAA